MSDSNYQHCPCSEEWDKVEKVKSFLKIFYDATLSFFGTKYPTSNLYFPFIFKICATLKQHRAGDDEYLKFMASQIWLKFQKYWSEFHHTLAVACILDPRYKLQFVDYSYRKLYEHNSIEYMLLKDKLFSLFVEYKSKMIANISTNKNTFATSNEKQTSATTDDYFKVICLLIFILHS